MRFSADGTKETRLVSRHYRRSDRVVQKGLFTLIEIYRCYKLPRSVPVCRYYPSCSHYAQEAIMEHGTLRGIYLSLWRIVRCGPWSGGGFDPVPIGRETNDHHRLEIVKGALR